MMYVKKLLVATGCIAWLYWQKVFIVECVFHYGCRVIPEDWPIMKQQVAGGILLNAIDIAICGVAIYFIGRIKNESLRFILFAILISPLLFEVSDLFNDKSCFKAWRHLDKLWWHVLISLPVWFLVANGIKRYREWFSRLDCLLFIAIFVVYHFLKKY
jgi:hypothetical protein